VESANDEASTSTPPTPATTGCRSVLPSTYLRETNKSLQGRGDEPGRYLCVRCSRRKQVEAGGGSGAISAGGNTTSWGCGIAER
jgi:hypothetical protein